MLNNITAAFTKTRIAPTPSGYLHLGNAMSFLLTAKLARKAGAKVLLRIDDMDQQRVNTDYVQDIFDTLDFLGIDWDEGPRTLADYQQNWSQMHRIALYNKALQQLDDHREVFACKCSRSQLQGLGSYPGTCRNRSLPLDSPEAAWRLYTDERQLKVNSLSGDSDLLSLFGEMRDFIVRKKDGYPAYQLSSMIDDVHFGVDMVVRGADLYPSTLAQLYLADVLSETSFQKTLFHHHQLIMETSDKKLSKSAGSTSIKYLRAQGKSRTKVYAEVIRLTGLGHDFFEGF